MKRAHVEELLDQGTGSDAEVAQSLADLRRINRVLGGRRVLRRLLDEQVRRTGLRRFSLLDVGAGSGDLPAAVLRWYPEARAVGLDFQLRHLLGASRGARPSRPLLLVCANAWQPPFRPSSFDFVTASLFAHHFSEQELPGLLRTLGSLARHALLINDLDRHWIPYSFIRLTTPLFARSPITRFDAPASVAQAFTRGELSRAASEAGFRRFRERWHIPFRRSLAVELAP